mmetsp:Transcript_21813/g.51929  ORF Transcript_21813/g.51929 Transcript_21813/m.51929 type:complete len:217 (-) Transcript_21813:33-683(-)
MGLPSFFTILSYTSGYVVLVFLAVCLACGLYYMAELAEEYTALTKKIIMWAIRVVWVLHFLLLVLDGFPFFYTVLSAASHGVYYQLLKTFPFITPTSPEFLGSCVCVVLNHVWWISYFRSETFRVLQVMGFFVPCVWLVPFAFFVSLSLNDNVLPGSGAPSSGGEIDTGDGVKSKAGSLLKVIFSFVHNKRDTMMQQYAPQVAHQFHAQDMSKKGW